MQYFLGSLPFWGMLALRFYEQRTDTRLTRDGFRTLSEKLPTPKQAEQLAGPQENQVAQAKQPQFPGDGYRPQALGRTG